VKHDEKLIEGIGQEIKDTLYGYLKAESTTYFPAERDAERYFLNYFKSFPYWKQHPDHVGTYPIPNDPFGRRAAFAMVCGRGNDTIAFVHHNDVVTTEDFKRLKPFAFSPDELEQELLKIKDSLSPEICADLESGRFLYGRGSCDMKGGGSIQMALLKRYSELVLTDPEALTGNLIVLAVPDEENLSAGMRAAVRLLADLKEKPSIRERLEDAKRECSERKPPEKGRPGRDTPEHGEL